MKEYLESSIVDYADYLKQFNIINKLTFDVVNIDVMKNTTTLELYVSEDGKRGVIATEIIWEDGYRCTETFPVELRKTLINNE